ncbi:sulfur carrier protein ThiS [Pedobacter antarcticus]|uniref:sulfur carrier protein ThiS n=1 Tax=Pedobacter antarcticus TaxID=34086 RepID=UPI001C571F04|nr:sulfur carrier protein ThiS [Pedobacter antarcticus]
MDITVNQKTYSLSQVCSVVQMLQTVIRHPLTGIAVAVNQQIISKADWGNYLLQPGDEVTIIKATQGG